MLSRFDMSPTSTFPYKDKKTGKVSHISFVDVSDRGRVEGLNSSCRSLCENGIIWW